VSELASAFNENVATEDGLPCASLPTEGLELVEDEVHRV
jgi:hypothetical protein